MENIKFTEICEKVIVNTTPHPINFDVDGEIVTVPVSGVIINARPEEVPVGPVGSDLVMTCFVGTAKGHEIIKAIKAQHSASEFTGMPLRIVGSIIAAQAYPMDVVAMTPAPGYERVAPAEKRMNPSKFTVFVE